VAASYSAPSVIAQAGSVELNSAVRFTIPTSENPGVLIHLPAGDFVAYNALCTHANCEVQYNATSQLLTCPCHGSTFDPSKKGDVLHPPATRALTELAINVDAVSGTITLNE
jgi:thiosulfate dehydrogenase [quinone] large subunit